MDKLIEGGIPKGSTVLVSGAPGTGKTILAMQFLEAGLRKGEKAAYITIEEQPAKIAAQAGQFGMFKKAPDMISAKDIKYDMAAKKPESMEEKIKLVLEKLGKMRPGRVVIDSVSSLTLEDGNARRLTRMLIEGLNKVDATCVLTGEALNGDYPDDVTAFLSDGVILMKKQAVGIEETRSLIVDKMRETKIDGGVHSLEFAKQGLKVA